VKVAYVVSRFPLVTETFIVRELTAVDAGDAVDVTLYSLFPADTSVVHPEARPWVEGCRRGSVRRGLGAVCWWAVRRPGATLRVVADVIRDHAGEPRVLAKSLVCTVIAFDHARSMQADGIEHVHAHFATFPALTAWVAHRLYGVSYSVTPHANDIFVSQAGLRRRLEHATFVVAISRYHAMFLQHFGARPERLPLVRCGLDLDAYPFTPRSIPPAGPVDVLMVSSFKAYKGHRFAIAALVEDPALERLHVEFVGDGPLKAEIEKLARATGVEHRCTFSGARDADYVAARLARASILLQPSVVQADGDTEGLPNTVIEGAATGAIVVAGAVTGVPELIEDGVSGYLAHPAESGDLARALREVLETPPEKLDAIRAEARRRVVEHHALSKSAATLTDLLTNARNGSAG